MPRTRKVKKTDEQYCAELWELARNLWKNGQKVSVVIQCDEMNVSKVQALLQQLSKLYGTKTLYITHFMKTNEWRLHDDLSEAA